MRDSKTDSSKTCKLKELLKGLTSVFRVFEWIMQAKSKLMDGHNALEAEYGQFVTRPIQHRHNIYVLKSKTLHDDSLMMIKSNSCWMVALWWSSSFVFFGYRWGFAEGQICLYELGSRISRSRGQIAAPLSNLCYGSRTDPIKYDAEISSMLSRWSQ